MMSRDRQHPVDASPEPLEHGRVIGIGRRRRYVPANDPAARLLLLFPPPLEVLLDGLNLLVRGNPFQAIQIHASVERRVANNVYGLVGDLLTALGVKANGAIRLAGLGAVSVAKDRNGQTLSLL